MISEQTKFQHFIIARNLLKGYVKIGAWDQAGMVFYVNHWQRL